MAYCSICEEYVDGETGTSNPKTCKVYCDDCYNEYCFTCDICLWVFHDNCANECDCDYDYQLCNDCLVSRCAEVWYCDCCCGIVCEDCCMC